MALAGILIASIHLHIGALHIIYKQTGTELTKTLGSLFSGSTP